MYNVHDFFTSRQKIQVEMPSKSMNESINQLCFLADHVPHFVKILKCRLLTLTLTVHNPTSFLKTVTQLCSSKTFLIKQEQSLLSSYLKIFFYIMNTFNNNVTCFSEVYCM